PPARWPPNLCGSSVGASPRNGVTSVRLSLIGECSHASCVALPPTSGDQPKTGEQVQRLRSSSQPHLPLPDTCLPLSYSHSFMPMTPPRQEIGVPPRDGYSAVETLPAIRERCAIG